MRLANSYTGLPIPERLVHDSKFINFSGRKLHFGADSAGVKELSDCCAKGIVIIYENQGTAEQLWDHSHGLFQAKMLVDIMIQKPCEVDLGSMVTLRKSLVLGVINQIATYLVVTTQFYNS